MKKIGIWVFYFTLALILNSTPTPAANTAPPCLTDLQTNFFTYELVAKACSLHRIPQGKWDLIFQYVKALSQNVPTMVNLEARKQQPNPLNPFQPVEAWKLTLYALETIFGQAVVQTYVTNDPTIIHEMFQYIRAHQYDRITSCLGKEVEASRVLTY